MNNFPAYLCGSTICGQVIIAALFFSGALAFELARFIWNWLFLVMVASFIAQCVADFLERRK